MLTLRMQNVETFQPKNGNGTGIIEPNLFSKPKREKITLSGVIMAADDKSAEKTEITKGMVWLIATSLIVLQLLLNYGGSAIGWARADQSNVEAIKTMQLKLDGMEKQFSDKNRETRDDVKELKDDFKEIQKGFQEMREDRATLKGAGVRDYATTP